MLYCVFQDEEPFPRSVVRLLWERHPDVRDAFRDRGLFVIEFQVGPIDVDDTNQAYDAVALAEAAYAGCAEAREARHVLFVAHARPDGARELATHGVAVPSGTFLGACGYVEGGIHFWAADGTFIESDDWTTARDYALRVAEHAGTA